MAVSLLIAATGGLTLGVLAVLRAGVARDRWLATVEAHGELQLWGWFAVFITAVVFEFIVRLNGRPPIPLRPRALVLVLLGGGAVLSATGRLVDVAGQALVTVGATSLVIGALALVVIVVRIRPAYPLRADLHPLFFRAGVTWLLLAALATLVASRGFLVGVTPFDESYLVAELVLRGFVMNVTIAVALRAFVGHLGLRPMPVERQRVLWVLVNLSIVVWASGTGAWGLHGVPSLVAAGDLLFAGGLLWATWALDVGRAARGWRRPRHRAQVLVPIAWIGLLTYAGALSVQAAVALAGSSQTSVFEAGATRHMLALGFVTPLLIAMAHVVLERFLIGRLFGETWLTIAFVLLVGAWPLRVVPPLVDSDVGATAQALMGTAGVLTSGALLIAAAVAIWNALATERYVRLLRSVEGLRPIPRASGTQGVYTRDPGEESTRVHEVDVRPDIAAGREPFPRLMTAVGQLAPGDRLRLIAPFKPLPLYGVLAEHGFDHETEVKSDGSWHVIIRRRLARG
ncbi:MAG: DUF2249 domain-containing protein [Dehalococcoidia bacterium]